MADQIEGRGDDPVVLQGQPEVEREDGSQHGRKDDQKVQSSNLSGGEENDLDKLVNQVIQRIRQLREDDRQRIILVKKMRQFLAEERQQAARVPAIAVLPEEVWRIVLRTVADPRTCMNLSHTCQLFGEILNPLHNGWQLEASLPFFYRHLSKGDFLKLRLVCKGMNRAILGFLNNHSSIHPHQEEESKDLGRMDIAYPLKQLKLHHRSNFIFSNDERDNYQLINDPRFPIGRGTNPFMGHYIHIQLGKDEFGEGAEDKTDDDWWKRLFHFLSILGHHIRYINITFPHNPSLLVQWKLAETLASTIIPSMPDLRKLMLNYRSPLSAHCRFTHLLPEAPKLETIELIRGGEMKVNGLERSLFLKYGQQQLKKLHVDAGCLPILSTMHLYHLNELWVDVTGLYGQSIHQGLSLLPGFKMQNLTKLVINFPLFCSRYHVEDLVILINNLSETTKLSTLRLVGDISSIEDDTDEEKPKRMRMTCNLRTTSLKTLEVELDADRTEDGDDPISFDFLVPWFSNLQYLVFYVRDTFPQNRLNFYDPGREVDFRTQEDFNQRATLDHLITCHGGGETVQIHRFLYIGQMYKSNIWELMPRLKQVSGQWGVCNRREYMEYKEKQITV